MSTLIRIAVRQHPLIFRSALLRCANASTPDFFVAPRFAAPFHSGITDHNSLAKKRPTEQGDVGTEGFHTSTRFILCGRSFLIRYITEDKKAAQSALTQVDAVSTVPQEVRGDWVLFHPVYSQEEMKSVEVHCVSSSFCPSCSMVADTPRVDPPQRSKDNL